MRITDEVKQQALNVRAALEASGLDYGPISVHDKMTAMGLPAPSTAALARIFREKAVVRLEPKKKPGLRTAGSCIPRRTRAGSSMPPSTSWLGAARA